MTCQLVARVEIFEAKSVEGTHTPRSHDSSTLRAAISPITATLWSCGDVETRPVQRRHTPILGTLGNLFPETLGIDGLYNDECMEGREVSLFLDSIAQLHL